MFYLILDKSSLDKNIKLEFSSEKATKITSPIIKNYIYYDEKIKVHSWILFRVFNLFIICEGETLKIIISY